MKRQSVSSSFLISTIRRMPAIISNTTASSTTALAQAAGYWSREIWFAIIRPTEALWPPLMSRTVMKSPMTSVTTKIEPMAMPVLLSGRMTLAITCQVRAPPSTAASIKRRSIRIMVLKIGVTMNSV